MRWRCRFIPININWTVDYIFIYLRLFKKQMQHSRQLRFIEIQVDAWLEKVNDQECIFSMASLDVEFDLNDNAIFVEIYTDFSLGSDDS